jgi:hypothetical protein
MGCDLMVEVIDFSRLGRPRPGVRGHEKSPLVARLRSPLVAR